MSTVWASNLVLYDRLQAPLQVIEGKLDEYST